MRMLKKHIKLTGTQKRSGRHSTKGVVQMPAIYINALGEQVEVRGEMPTPLPLQIYSHRLRSDAKYARSKAGNPMVVYKFDILHPLDPDTVCKVRTCWALLDNGYGTSRLHDLIFIFEHASEIDPLKALKEPQLIVDEVNRIAKEGFVMKKHYNGDDFS